MCLENGPNIGFANQRRQLDLRRMEFRSMIFCIDPATCLAGDFESRSSRWMDPYGNPRSTGQREAASANSRLGSSSVGSAAGR